MPGPATSGPQSGSATKHEEDTLSGVGNDLGAFAICHRDPGAGEMSVVVHHYH